MHPAEVSPLLWGFSKRTFPNVRKKKGEKKKMGKNDKNSLDDDNLEYFHMFFPDVPLWQLYLAGGLLVAFLSLGVFY